MPDGRRLLLFCPMHPLGLILKGFSLLLPQTFKNIKYPLMMGDPRDLDRDGRAPPLRGGATPSRLGVRATWGPGRRRTKGAGSQAAAATRDAGSPLPRPASVTGRASRVRREPNKTTVGSLSKLRHSLGASCRLQPHPTSAFCPWTPCPWSCCASRRRSCAASAWSAGCCGPSSPTRTSPLGSA